MVTLTNHTPKDVYINVRRYKQVRTKIMISHRILEQVSHFNYLGNYTGYDRNYGINVMLGKFHGTIAVYLETRYIEIRN